MKVLLINGSPHSGGCTYTALHLVAEALNEEKIDTEIVQITSVPVNGCIDCKKCFGKEKPECILNDQVNELAEKLAEADGLVIGSPVYFGAPNGKLIAILNRLFRIFRTSTGGKLAGKVGAAVVSARRSGNTASWDVLNKYFGSSCMPVVPSQQYWNMVHGYTPEDVMQDLEGVQTMRTLGKNMAWLLRCIKYGEANGITLPEPEKREKTNFIR